MTPLPRIVISGLDAHVSVRTELTVLPEHWFFCKYCRKELEVSYMGEFRYNSDDHSLHCTPELEDHSCFVLECRRVLDRLQPPGDTSAS